MYDYNTPGSFDLAYRVPDNLIGNSLINANMITQKINIDMMAEQVARKSKKTDNFCNERDFKQDTFRKLYPGPFEIQSTSRDSSPNKGSPNRKYLNSKLPETMNQAQQYMSNLDMQINHSQLYRQPKMIGNYKKKSPFSSYVNA